MAIIKCHECNQKISNTAPSCPKCGAPALFPMSTMEFKSVPPAVHRASQPFSTNTKRLIGGVIAVVLSIYAVSFAKWYALSQTPEYQAQEKKKAADAIAARGGATETQGSPDEATTKKPSDPLAMSPIVVGMSLKAAARDPDSLVIEKALNDKSSLFVCVSYRSKNGFGGMNRGHAVFTIRGGDESSGAWNRICTGDDMRDVTSEVTLGTTMK